LQVPPEMDGSEATPGRDRRPPGGGTARRVKRSDHKCLRENQATVARPGLPGHG